MFFVFQKWCICCWPSRMTSRSQPGRFRRCADGLRQAAGTCDWAGGSGPTGRPRRRRRRRRRGVAPRCLARSELPPPPSRRRRRRRRSCITGVCRWRHRQQPRQQAANNTIDGCPRRLPAQLSSVSPIPAPGGPVVTPGGGWAGAGGGGGGGACRLLIGPGGVRRRQRHQRKPCTLSVSGAIHCLASPEEVLGETTRQDAGTADGSGLRGGRRCPFGARARALLLRQLTLLLQPRGAAKVATVRPRFQFERPRHPRARCQEQVSREREYPHPAVSV